MSAHGPDANTHEKASTAELKPVKVGEGSMAFMFESSLMVGVTEWGLKKCAKVQKDYNQESWLPLRPWFIERRAGAKPTNGTTNGAPGTLADKAQVSPSHSGMIVIKDLHTKCLRSTKLTCSL